ncbi:MAG: hypothetical protein ACKVOW_17585 [Chitinophagaceae bacterium]
MKNFLPNEGTAVHLPLKQIVNNLAISFLPLTQERRSFIINHIESSIVLEKDENLLSLTFGNLLKNIILLSREQCIQVHSSVTRDYTLIRINVGDARFYNNLVIKTIALQQVIEKIGGSISMQYDERGGATIAFSVSNKLTAA